MTELRFLVTMTAGAAAFMLLLACVFALTLNSVPGWVLVAMPTAGAFIGFLGALGILDDER